MTKQGRLLKKITQHLRAADIQRYMHTRGPKWYTTAELVLGLAVRERYKLSYRRAAEFLDEYYGLSLHWTTLQKAAQRFPRWFWQRILRASARVESMLAAIDGTGFARSLPSEHYIKRIDGKRPAVPVKLSAMIDTESRLVLSARVRTRPAHDTKDVHGLIRRAHKKPWVVTMDKGYDSEPLHEWLDNKGVWSIAPTRKGCRRGRHRKQLRDTFPQTYYDQRPIIESVFRSVKARYGGHVRGRRAHTVHAEVMMRLILHNIRVVLTRYFLLTSSDHNIYISTDTYIT
ncbi:MAG: transposase [Candidatus Woesearchaeota archaeon]|nr:transposase [Candidatus Woesearchaeota archaeon]